MRRSLPVLLVLLLLLAAGCDQSLNRVSTLWTDVPEMASYVEKFNASQREWQILVEYRENLPSLLTTPGRKADLVVARGLASNAVKDTMVSLDFLFDGGRLAKASFYRRALDAGSQGDRAKLLPVAFDLPVLLFAPAVTPNVPPFSMDLNEVRLLQKSYVGAPGPTLRSVAFSPRWNRFGLTLLTLQGVQFREGFQGDLTWDSGRLAEGAALFRQWPGPGTDQLNEFRLKYLQADPAPLLASGRLQFYPSTLSALLKRPWEDRRNLDFRYLTTGNRVQAAESVVWAGIPSSSLTRGAAERFLAWFFQADTQKKLIAGARSEDSHGFGLAGELSAQTLPNAVLPTLFPDLEGRIPGEDQVEFWASLPPGWTEGTGAVVQSWLETPTGTETTLKADLERHRAQLAHN